MKIAGRLAGLGMTFVVLAAVVMLPPVLAPRPLELRVIDEAGHDQRCPPSFAHATTPDRSAVHARAFLDDLAYAAAAAGPIGSGLLVAALAMLVWLVSCLTRGLRCAMRRILVTFAIGIPGALCVLYLSCFLDGRAIRLGPDALDWIPASLHTQTHRTTGLLSPSDLVRWHYQRGFRVLNVSDRDTTAGALAARKMASQKDFRPSLLVLIGEEWHGHPDIVLVNAKQDWKPGNPALPELVQRVREQGGASFLAHPWAKLPGTLDESLVDGLDGVEIVNGVIHGGTLVRDAAKKHEKCLLGTTDYKYGPHVNVITLLPAEAAKSPANVVRALRHRHTRILYAVPGGAVTGEVWKARRLGLTSAQAGLRSLCETPRQRRLVWFGWLALTAALWRVSTWKKVAAPARLRGPRLLFFGSAIVLLALPLALGWQFRERFGTVAIPVLLAMASVAIVPLLATSHMLGRAELSDDVDDHTADRVDDHTSVEA